MPLLPYAFGRSWKLVPGVAAWAILVKRFIKQSILTDYVEQIGNQSTVLRTGLSQLFLSPNFKMYSSAVMPKVLKSASLLVCDRAMIGK